MLPSNLLASVGGMLTSTLRPSSALGASFVRRCSALSSSPLWKKHEPERAEDSVSKFVEEASDILELPSGLECLILTSDRKFTMQLEVPMDNGEVELFSAHRVQHNNARGPFKGGILYHPSATLPMVESLASLNTWKTAMLDVPFGGAKGGVQVDPERLSARELEKLTRKLVQSMKNLMGPWTDIPAPDIGTDERVMAWVFDEFSKHKGFSPGCVTGKPLHLHGSLGRDSATGRGLLYASREFLREVLFTKVAGTSFVIQGFGKVGSNAARALHDAGAKVVAIADSKSAVMNERGLDIPALQHHVGSGAMLSEFEAGTPLPSNPDFLALPCDVLIPAALSDVINADVAAKLQCKAVIEGANAPTTMAGDAVLRERGIHVLPDIYANGGGVVVSFFEWVQNMQNFRWEDDEIQGRLDRYMTDAFASLHSLATAKKLPLRTAAFVLAVDRVAKAETHRGFD